MSLNLATFKEKVYERKSVYLIMIFLLVLDDIWAMKLKKSVNISIMTLKKYEADML